MFWESIHNILTNSIFSMLLINSATFGTSLDLSFENSGNDLANGKNLGNLSQNEVTPLPTTIKSNGNEVYKDTHGKEITNVQDSKMNLVPKIQLSPKSVNIYQPVSIAKSEQSDKNSKKIPTPKEALEQNISLATEDNKAQEPVVNHIYFYKELALPTMYTQPITIANNAPTYAPNALESYLYQKEEKTSEDTKAAAMLFALAYILSTNNNPEEQGDKVYNYSPPIARSAIFLHTYSKNKATQISSENVNSFDFSTGQIKLAMNRMLTELVPTFAKETFENLWADSSELLKTLSALFALGIISYLFRSRRRHSAYLRNILGAIYEFCHAFFVEKTQPAYEHSENQPEFEKIFESSFFIGYKFDPKFTELCNRQIIMRERLEVNV